MVRIGIIGIGFMGMIHYYGIQKILGGKVTAICTRSPEKLNGDWTSIQGNFGPRGSIEDLSEIKTYDDIDAIFELKRAGFKIGFITGEDNEFCNYVNSILVI